jgi:hypothetical protein
MNLFFIHQHPTVLKKIIIQQYTEKFSVKIISVTDISSTGQSQVINTLDLTIILLDLIILSCLYKYASRSSTNFLGECTLVKLSTNFEQGKCRTVLGC